MDAKEAKGEAKGSSFEASCFTFEGGGAAGGEEEEEVFFENTGSEEDNEFDQIVGSLEDIMLEGRITSIQNEFFEEHYAIFEDTEENKIEYTQIFEKYTAMMEGSLNSLLTAKIPGFSMERFEEMLVKRQDEIMGEIFDLILSLGDFTEFKDLILNYKKRKMHRKSKQGDIHLVGKTVSSP